MDDKATQFDPWNPKHFGKLMRSVEQSNDKMREIRDRHDELVSKHLQEHKNYPLPYLQMAATIYMTNVAANEPNILVVPQRTELAAEGSELQLMTAQVIREKNLLYHTQRATMHALHSIGIVHIAMEECGTVELRGRTHRVCEPRLRVIKVVDYVVDMSADYREEVGYEGHYERMPVWKALQDPRFDEGARALIARSDDARTPSDRPRSDREEQEVDKYQEEVELLHLYMPEEKLKLICLPRHGMTEPLHVENWKGPRNGPYRKLAFDEAPDKLFPLAPLGLLKDLNDIANDVWNKLGEVIKNMKDVFVGQAGSEKDVKKIQLAKHLELILTANGMPIEHVKVAGNIQDPMAVGMNLRQLFSYFGGNLDSVGGLGAASDTVGQDKLIATASSRRMAQMGRQVEELVRGIASDLMFWEYSNPLLRRRISKPILDTGYSMPVELRSRGGRPAYLVDGQVIPFASAYLDHNYIVEAYSMQHRSPRERLQAIISAMGIVMQNGQMLAAQNKTIDFQAFLDIVREYENLPEIRRLIIDAAPPSPDTAAKDEQRMAPHTTREYVRHNRSSVTPQGQEAVLMQQAMGANPQRKQKAQAVGV